MCGSQSKVCASQCMLNAFCPATVSCLTLSSHLIFSEPHFIPLENTEAVKFEFLSFSSTLTLRNFHSSKHQFSFA